MADKNFGERLRRLRGKKSITEVAKACEISPSALSMYENSQRVPRDPVKRRLASYYGKSVGYIFFSDFTHETLEKTQMEVP